MSLRVGSYAARHTYQEGPHVAWFVPWSGPKPTEQLGNYSGLIHGTVYRFRCLPYRVGLKRKPNLHYRSDLLHP